ncbi:hypothetical protein AWB68_07822 [Caballeronia choica]|jgi:uncharacterized membrane protein|uniref:DUF2127 domain-containing protein n=1 Tax=Caballeronia choica TaxID=326476 RepID=A0A158KY15_9BURK|nr:DUF2127 domain-containing protein [Caballeronia choica]SAL85845.1 hypothetical protein AWB68_07822 [Caballeronia choica]
MFFVTLNSSIKALTQQKLHLVFTLGLWCKALRAIPEVVAGIATLVVSRQGLLAFVVWVTKDEFGEDPHDLLASFLLHTVQHLSIGTQEFAAVYLLGHGTMKLWLIAGLLRKKLWYFPVAITVFTFFIAYQLYRYTITHSIWLLLITGLDLVIIALTWHEYRGYQRERKARTNAEANRS